MLGRLRRHRASPSPSRHRVKPLRAARAAGPADDWRAAGPAAEARSPLRLPAYAHPLAARCPRPSPAPGPRPSPARAPRPRLRSPWTAPGTRAAPVKPRAPACLSLAPRPRHQSSSSATTTISPAPPRILRAYHHRRPNHAHLPYRAFERHLAASRAAQILSTAPRAPQPIHAPQGRGLGMRAAALLASSPSCGPSLAQPREGPQRVRAEGRLGPAAHRLRRRGLGGARGRRGCVRGWSAGCWSRPPS